MIKFVLVVLAVTPQGPTVQEIAQFTRTNQQYCEDVGKLVVRNLEQRGIKAAYRCIERTNV